MKTRNGIYYDLEESPYITKFKDFRFHFSSEFYRRKFENELFEYINKERYEKTYSYNLSSVACHYASRLLYASA